MSLDYTFPPGTYPEIRKAIPLLQSAVDASNAVRYLSPHVQYRITIEIVAQHDRATNRIKLEERASVVISS
jgi:hypothetical protein